MGERLAGEGASIGVMERRWAAIDRGIGVTLLLISGVCVAAAVVGFGSRLAGNVVHPDAIFIPLIAGLLPGGIGVLFLLAAAAMRRGSAGRWTAQVGALLVPAVLALFIGLSYW